MGGNMKRIGIIGAGRCDETIYELAYEVGRMVAERLDAEHSKVEFVGSLRNLNRRLDRLLKEGDVLITLGAGDITRIGRRLCQDLQ